MLETLEAAPHLARTARLSGRGPDFSPNVTRAIWAQLSDSERKCAERLLDAQIEAHAANRRNSDRSFRNCSIEASAKWIESRRLAFRRAVDAGDPEDATKRLGEAIAALHAFYAYTNYVELVAEELDDWDLASSTAHRVWWSSKGALEDPSRLLADFAPGALPDRCPGGVRPDLDKSTATTPRGQELLEAFGMTKHAAVVELALIDTRALLREEYKARPTYGERCGSRSVFTWMREEFWE